MNQDFVVRNIRYDDVPKIIELQKESFPYLASEGVIWKPANLESHIKIFPEGQLCIEIDGKIVASASSLVVSLKEEYSDHTWNEITSHGTFANHDKQGDSLYGADISTHPDVRRLGVATALYDARKELAIRLNLRRIIAGGRLFNYCDYAGKMTALQYAQKVVDGSLTDPVLSFQLRNGFQFIKILPNYMKDSRSLNYASFIEWINPHFKEKTE